MTTNLPPMTKASLQQWVAAARRTAQGDGALWQNLLGCAGGQEEALATALREHYGVSLVDDDGLAQLQLQADQAGFCLAQGEHGNVVLCEDPWSAEASAFMVRRASANTVLALAKPGQLARLKSRAAPSPAATARSAQAASPADGNSVIALVDKVIARARTEGASDIHFETDRQGLRVKYRLDGVMTPGEQVADPRKAEEVISRIKVMSQLDITERRRPQDGRIRWQANGHDAIDLRVSIMPSIFGEDAVLRLLDKAQLQQSERLSLDTLGFEPEVAATLRELAARPHGMLLITGPTGSGKTTTVYAALSEVNDGLEKIVTIEDPVEYELPGVLQIPVNEQKGLTFATGLRSILRHDPDKILVGEIRDAETAQIAVQSSLTGHLVFTTVHANSLFDVLGRFQHFGIDRFAMASALNGVVVQRLLRRLCPHCTGWRDCTAQEVQQLQALGLPVPAKLPVPHGCEHCRNTGYRGRFVVAEVHRLDDKVRDLMIQGASMSELKAAAYGDGSRRLLPQALRQVEQGITSLTEVARVVGLA
jgi:general secretion pathway protein E